MTTSAKKAKVFVPLRKVDEEQRLVYGLITQEILDKAGEVMDYASSKPHFEKWSNDIHTASKGLSKGNVRVMHGLSVAGKLTDLQFDDAEKSIEVCAKVVDDGEWNKVLEGCYTGFSVGGSYGKRWTETGEDKVTKVKKFTAVPNEVSLVDNPCVPSATFTLVKADGEEPVPFQVENDDDQWPGFAKSDDGMKAGDDAEDGVTNDDGESGKKKKKKDNKKFVAKSEPSNDDVVKKAEELAKAANDGSTWMAHVEAAREELIKVGMTQTLMESSNEEAAPTDEEADDGDEDKSDDKTAEAETAQKVTPPGVRQVWTAGDNKVFEKKADAEAHELTLVKAELTEAEKLRQRLSKATDAPVEKESDEIFSIGRIDDLHKALLELEQPRQEDGSPALEKGMYTVSRFANMMGDVASLARTIKAEQKLEEDSEDGAVHKALSTHLSSLGESFMDYAKNQIAELVAGIDAELSPKVAYDYYYRAAGEGNDLAKNVAEMIEAVQEELEPAIEKVNKLAKAFGFTDSSVEEDDTPSLQKRFDDLFAENEALSKVANEAVSKVEDLAKRVSTIEDTPLPRAPRNIVEKTADTMFMGKAAVTEDERMKVLKDMLAEHSSDELATMMIKASQSSGGSQLGLKTP